MPHQQKSRARLLILCMVFLFCLLAIPVNPHGRASPNSNQVKNSDVQPLSTGELVWERTYGGAGDDRAFCMTPTDDGGFLIGGSSTSFNPMNKTAAWVVKIDGEGSAVWNKTYFENDGSEFRNIQKTADGFLLVGNTFFSSGMEDAWIVKIDNEGNVAWNKTIGGENFNKVFSAATAADGFVFAGLTNSSNNGNSQGWLLKTDMDGNLLWNKTYAEVGDSAFRAIIVSTTGDYVAAGYSASATNGNYGLWLVKTDSSGTMIWSQLFSGVDDKGYGLVASKDGYVVVGESHASQEANSDAFAAKTDFNGRLIWKKTYGGANFDVASAVTPTRDGGYLVVGFTFSYGKGQRDFWFFEIDDSGNVAWSRTYGREGYEEAYAAVEVGDNEFVISGWTNSIGAGSYDFYVVRTKIVTTTYGIDLGMFGYVVLALLGAVIVGLFGYLCLRLYRDTEKTRKRDFDIQKMENH